MKFTYDEATYYPSAPVLEIQLGKPDESFTIGPVYTLVDTGADATLIPNSYIHSLNIQMDDRKYLHTQWGERQLVNVYFLDIGIST